MSDPDPEPQFDLYPFAPSRADVARRLRNFIDYWRDETFPGSPLTESVDLWIFIRHAIDDLKDRIVHHI